MSKIEPALTAEEWAKLEFEDGSIDRYDRYDKPRVWFNDEIMWTERLHALAALCLHNQPFGFTWEDVDALRQIERREGRARMIMYGIDTLAERLAALLPPRES